MYPYNAGYDDEGHRRQNHKTVVDVTGIVEALRHYLKSQQSAGAEQFAEECHDDEYYGISDAVADTVEERRPWSVGHGKGFETAHKYAVGDNQADEYRELFVYVVGVGL